MQICFALFGRKYNFFVGDMPGEGLLFEHLSLTLLKRLQNSPGPGRGLTWTPVPRTRPVQATHLNSSHRTLTGCCSQETAHFTSFQQQHEQSGAIQVQNSVLARCSSWLHISMGNFVCCISQGTLFSRRLLRKLVYLCHFCTNITRSV